MNYYLCFCYRNYLIPLLKIQDFKKHIFVINFENMNLSKYLNLIILNNSMFSKISNAMAT